VSAYFSCFGCFLLPTVDYSGTKKNDENNSIFIFALVSKKNFMRSSSALSRYEVGVIEKDEERVPG